MLNTVLNRRVLTVIGLLLLCSTLAIGAHAWLRAPMDTVAVTVTATGFTPPEITLSAGSFNLSVTNQSGTDGLAMKLMRDSGEVVQEFTLSQGTQQWSGEVTLSAGGYTLTEANHPAWLFHITAQ